MSAGRLAVLAPGPRTLLVDGGRAGYEHLGLPRGGAADPELHALALLIAGAPADAATLECTAAGPTLECRDAPVRLGVAGECALRLRRVGEEALELAPWRSVVLQPGDRLRVGATRGALRAYLGVAGGMEVSAQLGSRSVSLRGGLTGLLGRPLRGGDVLPAGAALVDDGKVRLDPPAELLSGGPLRVCRGPASVAVDGDVVSLLTDRKWRVSVSSDRVGVRLEGLPLPLRGRADVPSMGCPPGAVQVGGDGLPMLLGCDRGTTGGYAVVAVVISADLPRLSRLRPGDEVRFAGVDVEEAVALRRARAALLASVAARVRGG